ncbi:MAG: sulfotransferase [Bacteroidota bacterium]
MLTKSSRTKIILILGMHRSGTSLVAQLIAKWGAYMGHDLMPADAHNQSGYWEYQPLVDFHEKLLQKTNNIWYAPSEAFDVKQLLFEYGDEAREMVEQMDKGGEVWCWKDPRTSLFLDFWKEILLGREIIFIITNRNLEAVTSSLFIRDKLPSFISIALWEFSTYKIIEALNPAIKYKWIDYDKIISEPETVISELFLFLNNSFQITENQAVFDHMIRSVKKSLNHVKPFTISKLSPFQISLHRIVGEGYIPENYKIPQNQLGYLQEIFAFFRKSQIANQSWQSAQLFFKNEGNEYIEELSLITEIAESQKQVLFKFGQPTRVKQLRFDPLNDYARILINSIQLLNQGKPLDIELKLSSNALCCENEEYLFDTNDPQVFLDFPDDNSVELDEVIVEVEYLQIGLETFPPLFKQKNIQIELSKEKALFLSESLQTSEYRNDCLEKEVAENNILIQKQAENIGLQNGLLSSLKTSNEELLNQFNKLEMQIKRQNSELLNIKKRFSFKLSRVLEIPLLLFRPLKLIGLMKEKLKLNRNISLLKQSLYFDRDYYLKNNPDVKVSGMSAIKHYLLYGGFEDRKPSEKFDLTLYLSQNPEVIKSGMNPLVHYLKIGKKEVRSIH